MTAHTCLSSEPSAFICPKYSQPAKRAERNFFSHSLTPLYLVAWSSLTLRLPPPSSAAAPLQTQTWWLVAWTASVVTPGDSLSCVWPLVLGQLEQTCPLSLTAHIFPSTTQQFSEKAVTQNASVLLESPTEQNWAGGCWEAAHRLHTQVSDLSGGLRSAFLAGSQLLLVGASDPWNHFYFSKFLLEKFTNYRKLD